MNDKGEVIDFLDEVNVLPKTSKVLCPTRMSPASDCYCNTSRLSVVFPQACWRFGVNYQSSIRFSFVKFAKKTFVPNGMQLYSTVSQADSFEMILTSAAYQITQRNTSLPHFVTKRMRSVHNQATTDQVNKQKLSCTASFREQCILFFRVQST